MVGAGLTGPRITPKTDRCTGPHLPIRLFKKTLMTSSPLRSPLNPRLLQTAAILLLGLLILPSCATIRSGSKQKIPVTTRPSGATVTVTNPTGKVVARATTPGTLVLKRGAGYFKAANYTATVAKPGYQSQQIPIVKDKINKWYAANVFGLASITLGALVVDPSTGAMYILKPSAIDVTLSPAKGGTRR